jgi:hypothetical protein
MKGVLLKMPSALAAAVAMVVWPARLTQFSK